MKIRKALFLFFTGLLFLAGCQGGGRQEAAGLKIQTSFYPIYNLTKMVSGDLNQVEIVNAKQSIHSFEPAASDLVKIEDSDVFIYHSHILEGWTKNLADNLHGKDVTVVEAGANLKMTRVPGLEDIEPGPGQDASNLLDPHTWLDPILVADEAQAIAEALGKKDPEHKDTYLKNAEKVKTDAEALVEKYRPQFDQLEHKTFVTQHTAFNYLAQRFGLKQLGIAGISDSQEPSAKQLAEVEDFVKEYHVKTIFTESQASEHLAQVISQATGAELKPLNPLEVAPDNEKDILENIAEDLETLATSLK